MCDVLEVAVAVVKAKATMKVEEADVEAEV